MRQKGAAEDWGWGVGERGSLLTEGGSHKGVGWGKGANLRIYSYKLHLPIKGFSLRSNT